MVVDGTAAPVEQHTHTRVIVKPGANALLRAVRQRTRQGDDGDLRDGRVGTAERHQPGMKLGEMIRVGEADEGRTPFTEMDDASIAGDAFHDHAVRVQRVSLVRAMHDSERGVMKWCRDRERRADSCKCGVNETHEILRWGCPRRVRARLTADQRFCGEPRRGGVDRGRDGAGLAGQRDAEARVAQMPLTGQAWQCATRAVQTSAPSSISA